MIVLGIDLRGPDAGMAQQFLQGANLGASGKHMSRETMAKRMRTDFATGTNPGCVTFDQLPDGDPR